MYMYMSTDVHVYMYLYIIEQSRVCNISKVLWDSFWICILCGELEYC